MAFVLRICFMQPGIVKLTGSRRTKVNKNKPLVEIFINHGTRKIAGSYTNLSLLECMSLEMELLDKKEEITLGNRVCWSSNCLPDRCVLGMVAVCVLLWRFCDWLWSAEDQSVVIMGLRFDCIDCIVRDRFETCRSYSWYRQGMCCADAQVRTIEQIRLCMSAYITPCTGLICHRKWYNELSYLLVLVRGHTKGSGSSPECDRGCATPKLEERRAVWRSVNPARIIQSWLLCFLLNARLFSNSHCRLLKL